MEETYYCSTCECDLAGKLIPWGKKLLCPDCVGKLKHNPLSHMAWGLKLGGWSVHFWPVTDTLDVLADWQIGGGILVYSPGQGYILCGDYPEDALNVHAEYHKLYEIIQDDYDGETKLPKMHQLKLAKKMKV